MWRLEAAEGGVTSGAPAGHQRCLEVGGWCRGGFHTRAWWYLSLLWGDFFWKGLLGCLMSIYKMLLIHVFSCFRQIVKNIWGNWFSRVVKRCMCPSIYVGLCLWPVITVVFVSKADLFSSKISFYFGAWDITYFRYHYIWFFISNIQHLVQTGRFKWSHLAIFAAPRPTEATMTRQSYSLEALRHPMASSTLEKDVLRVLTRACLRKDGREVVLQQKVSEFFSLDILIR